MTTRDHLVVDWVILVLMTARGWSAAEAAAVLNRLTDDQFERIVNACVGDE